MLGKFKIKEVIPFVRCNGRESGKRKKIYKGNDNKEYIVLMGNQKYKVFRNNLSCVCCGLTGSFFKLIKVRKKQNRAFFDLYAINNSGEEILMTRDHIIPISRNGTDALSNLQTMCTVCNNFKRSQIIDLDNLKNILQIAKTNFKTIGAFQRYLSLINS
jgi:5-methylcytosine-specific restriction endonuclease McrA